MSKIALIHTSFVLFEREKMLFELLEEMLPDVDVTNIVDEKMARDVLDRGYVTPALTRRMCYYVLAAAAMGVDVIFNTCSSMGPAIDVARELVDIPVLKIDEAMAEKAAEQGTKVGVLATSATTLKPTVRLIIKKAEGLDKRVETHEGLCDGAFWLLVNGELQRHDDEVTDKARELASWADTLVLAQASMARLAPRLSQETGLPVLSSPRLGVERLRQVLEQGG